MAGIPGKLKMETTTLAKQLSPLANEASTFHHQDETTQCRIARHCNQ
jgi:hypothetical protein